MRDIAAHLGISASTVSLAMRNDPRIRSELREKIKKTATQLGYQADPAISALASYRFTKYGESHHNTIGVLIDHPDESIFHATQTNQRLIEGIQSKAKEYGYKVEPFWLSRDYPRSESLDRVLHTRGIKGLILQAFYHRSTQPRFNWDHYSAVKIDQFPESLRLDSIQSNQMLAVRMAVKKMREQGYERIGLLTHSEDDIRSGNLITSGYFSEINSDPAHALPAIPPLLFEGDNPGKTWDSIIRWILKHKLQIVLSNWNCFELPIEEASGFLGKPCQFVSLCLDSRYGNQRGINQRHDSIGAMAVTLLAHKLRTFETGESPSPTIHLVPPVWQELTDSNSIAPCSENNKLAFAAAP